MANHRAPRRAASRTGSTHGFEPPAADMPAPAPAPVSMPGKRKAVKPSRAARTLPRNPQTSSPIVAPPSPSTTPVRTGGRKNLFPLLPSAPTVVGAAALVIAATGAVTFTHSTDDVTAASSMKFRPASALTGTSAETSSLELDSRSQAVSRDSQRAALQDAADEKLQKAAEAQAQERNAALAQLAASAEKYAGQIAANAWHLPVSGYHLTAGFGESSGLWAHTHTGLDFAAPTGTPVVSVANGTVRSTEYSGAYGNRVVLALEDGTEIWYCHLSAYNVSPGETVTGGQQLGLVGATGNVTGPHLHLEVRPGAGDPVDPYAALMAHGLHP
ncbi:MAG TPA: M23 family metallopeptidase [Nocardioidaceae bacterium]|nr:M23 family metallopeptidase [Nocardioidaceae bacterium]